MQNFESATIPIKQAKFGWWFIPPSGHTGIKTVLNKTNTHMSTYTGPPKGSPLLPIECIDPLLLLRLSSPLLPCLKWRLLPRLLPSPRLLPLPSPLLELPRPRLELPSPLLELPSPRLDPFMPPPIRPRPLCRLAARRLSSSTSMPLLRRLLDLRSLVSVAVVLIIIPSITVEGSSR